MDFRFGAAEAAAATTEGACGAYAAVRCERRHDGEVLLGLGRIVALYYRSFTLYQTH